MSNTLENDFSEIVGGELNTQNIILDFKGTLSKADAEFLCSALKNLQQNHPKIEISYVSSSNEEKEDNLDKLLQTNNITVKEYISLNNNETKARANIEHNTLYLMGKNPDPKGNQKYESTDKLIRLFYDKDSQNIGEHFLDTISDKNLCFKNTQNQVITNNNKSISGPYNKPNNANTNPNNPDADFEKFIRCGTQSKNRANAQPVDLIVNLLVNGEWNNKNDLEKILKNNSSSIQKLKDLLKNEDINYVELFIKNKRKIEVIKEILGINTQNKNLLV